MDKSAKVNALGSLIGKAVWFRTNDSNVNRGVVREVEDMGHARIEIINPINMEFPYRHVHANDIFMTREDLLSSNYEQSMKKIDSYCSDIKAVTDLVKFCYDKYVEATAGNVLDNSDWEVRMAARRMAMELLGVEIDPKAAAQAKELAADLELDVD